MRRDHSGDGVKDFEFRQRASQRASAKRLRAIGAWAKSQERERARAEKQSQRAYVAAQKENIRSKQEEIARDIEAKNRELAEHVDLLQKILEHTLSVDDTISFDALKVKEDFPPLSIPEHLMKKNRPPDKNMFSAKPLNWFTKLCPKAEQRNDRKRREAEEKYKEATKNWENQEAIRTSEIDKLKKEYEEKKKTFLLESQKHNQEIDQLKQSYFDGDPDAILYYNELVLDRSEYPNEFTHDFVLSYDVEGKTLNISFDFPPLSIIPTLKELKYIKRENTLKEIPRKDTEISSIYKNTIAAMALRTVHEIFEADQASHITTIEFEGQSDLLDKATGQEIRLFVSTTKDQFSKINLALVDKMACLKELRGRFASV